jgi:hypothetical protein
VKAEPMPDLLLTSSTRFVDLVSKHQNGGVGHLLVCQEALLMQHKIISFRPHSKVFIIVHHFTDMHPKFPKSEDSKDYFSK